MNPFYNESKGSWFVSPEGESLLCKLGNFFNNCKEFNRILFYGSSMGRYAALCLGFLVKNSYVISECPQIFLDKHPGSRYVCQSTNVDKSFIEPLAFLERGQEPNKVVLVCSIWDNHYKKHVIPFIEEIREMNASFKLHTHLYSNPGYSKGHVALKRKDAFALIDYAFESESKYT